MASILVVTTGSLDTIQSALKVAGHEVLVARDDAALVDAARQRRFDLALIDLDQYELADVARDVSTKVVLFSGATEDITRERVKKSRANGYVRKLGPERIRDDVQFLLARS
jgi:DNA-binding response OmpR family regulator